MRYQSIILLSNFQSAFLVSDIERCIYNGHLIKNSAFCFFIGLLFCGFLCDHFVTKPEVLLKSRPVLGLNRRKSRPVLGLNRTWNGKCESRYVCKSENFRKLIFTF